MFFHKKRLLSAADHGDLEHLNNLLAAGVDVNIHAMNGITPLMVASRQGHIEIVRALLEAGADPDIQDNFGGRSALMFATMESRA